MNQGQVKSLLRREREREILVASMPGINEPVALIRVIEILKPKKRERERERMTSMNDYYAVREMNERRCERARQEYQLRWMENIQVREREREIERLRENF